MQKVWQSQKALRWVLDYAHLSYEDDRVVAVIGKEANQSIKIQIELKAEVSRGAVWVNQDAFSYL